MPANAFVLTEVRPVNFMVLDNKRAASALSRRLSAWDRMRITLDREQPHVSIVGQIGDRDLC
jgi:hypothetical protein